MDTQELLISAENAVEGSGIAEEYRVVAFSKVLDLLTRQQRDVPARTSNGVGPLPEDGKSILSTLARNLHLENEIIAEIYDEADGDLHLIIAPSILEKANASATKQIALLVAAGRQAGGVEDWTLVSTIRAWCADFGRLDSANFAKTIASMGDVFGFRGDSQKKVVRVNKVGIENTTDLIRKLKGVQTS